jgi:hypothetical protein
MADLTEETAVTPEDLAKWFLIKKQLGELKAVEAMMRKRIFNFYFPAPEEGTNTFPLKDGTGAELKATHVIDRKVDEGELEALKEAMFAEGSNLPELDLTKLIKWKPELAISEYRKLSDEERLIFDRCLVVKPGMPQVDIKIPKRASSK